MAYTGGYILGCNSPALGNDKATYTAKFDAAMAAVDNHDHSSGKGKPISTLGIADLAITGAKIADLAITSNKLNTDAVTTAKVLDAAITTPKLADGSVTKAKLAAVGQQVSTSCGIFNTAAPGGAVTNLSVSYTTTGRPVKLSLVPDGSGDVAMLVFNPLAASMQNAEIQFLQGATILARQGVGQFQNGHGLPASAFSHTEYGLAAGTYTFSVKAICDIGGIGVYSVKLVVQEI
jgi:hypothetical protein